MSKPKVIEYFPGRLVEWHLRTYGRLPSEEPMKQPPMSLIDRLHLAAQACRAAHLLSCEASIREAIAILEKKQSGDKQPDGNR